MSLNQQRQRGYPLITLFLLVGACGVMAGMLTAAIRALDVTYVSPSIIWRSCIIVGLLAGAAGACVGLLHHRRFRSMLLGIATGLILGAWIGVIAIVPPEQTEEMWAIGLGSALVVAIIAIIQYSRKG